MRTAPSATGRSELAEAVDLFIVRGCRDCHLPLGGAFSGAADILAVHARLDRQELRRVLRHGLPPAMPAPGLSAEQEELILSLFAWLGSRRYAIQKRGGPIEAPGVDGPAAIPWWEFP